jgi:hypothetical protein
VNKIHDFGQALLLGGIALSAALLGVGLTGRVAPGPDSGLVKLLR